jgi:hypothetical protein
VEDLGDLPERLAGPGVLASTSTPEPARRSARGPAAVWCAARRGAAGAVAALAVPDGASWRRIGHRLAPRGRTAAGGPPPARDEPRV